MKIRRDRQNGYSFSDLSEKYLVTRWVVWQILHSK
jgi:hypothetical protein